MIQLATAPHPSRMGMPAAANDDRASEFKRGRSGHAWPFISRLSDKPAAQDAFRRVPGNSGS